MKGQDLLVTLGEISHKYYEEAEKDTLPAPRRVSTPRRYLLIAALIGLMLLLVGCVAAAFMGLQQRRIAQSTITRYQNEQGNWIVPTEESTDVISLFGYEGSSHYQAALEWYAFEHTYDPERKLLTDENELGIPDNYWYSYNCYTLEMVEEVDRICEKYGLKPMGEFAVAQRWDTEIFLDALHLSGLIRQDARAQTEFGSGYFYPEGAFKMSVDIRLTGEDAGWKEEVWSEMMYTPKGCFDPKYITAQSEKYDQWTYTTTQGVELSIAMHQNSAVLFTEQKNGYLTVMLSMDPLWMGKNYPSREILQQIAEIYDFRIQPQPPEDMEAVREALRQSYMDWEVAQAELEEQRRTAMACGDYGTWLIQNYPAVNDTVYYALRDINGDGLEDLLLGDTVSNTENAFSMALTMAEGEIAYLVMIDNFRICEDDTLAGFRMSGVQKHYTFNRLEGYSEDGSHNVFHESVSYNRLEGVWRYKERDIISEVEAQKIQDKYTPVEIPVLPLMEYPVDETGTTLKDYILANTVELTKAERMDLYRSYIKEDQEKAYIPSTHYMLMDVNADGIEDLLLTYEEENIHNIITIRNGEIYKLHWWTTLYLCEDNVWEQCGTTTTEERHSWFTMDPEGDHYFDTIHYSAAETQRWCRDADGDMYYEQDITEEGFYQILASRPRVKLDLIPISEFPIK